MAKTWYASVFLGSLTIEEINKSSYLKTFFKDPQNPTDDDGSEFLANSEPDIEVLGE